MDFSHARPTLEAGPANSPAYGALGSRIGAYVVDGLVLCIPLTVVLNIALLNPVVDVVGQSWAHTVGSLLEVFMACGYFAAKWSSSRQTIGMKQFRIGIVDARSGASIGRGRAVARFVLILLVASAIWLPMAYIRGVPGSLATVAIVLGIVALAATDPRRQALWDKATSTVVVDVPAS